MNKQETLQILAVLRLAYPGYYKGYNDGDYDDMAMLWEDMFPDEPSAVVGAAVRSLIATDAKGFPPAIGAVKGMIAKLSGEPELTEAEAWRLVKNAMSAYATREEFLRLPPAVQRAVGGASQLCQWAITDQKELPVIMSAFMRSYRTALEQQRERALIPKDIQAFLREGVQDALPGRDGGRRTLPDGPAEAAARDGE